MINITTYKSVIYQYYNIRKYPTVHNEFFNHIERIAVLFLLFVEPPVLHDMIGKGPRECVVLLYHWGENEHRNVLCSPPCQSHSW